jgi:hypothetical protein
LLMNDQGAIARADEANLAALPAILDWLQHHPPRGNWGSPAALCLAQACARARRQQSLNEVRRYRTPPSFV